MPRQDKTGPEGQGPATGRGLGGCKGGGVRGASQTPANNNQPFPYNGPYGRGFGRGRGRGQGRGFGRNQGRP